MDNHQSIPTPLPENLEAEHAVLGAMLIDPQKSVDEAMNQLQGNEFVNGSNRKIFKVAQELYQESLPVDMVTITERLRVKGWLEDNSVTHLSRMASATPTASNIGYYIGIVKEVHSQRQLIKELEDRLEQARGLARPSEVIASTQSGLEGISDQTTEKKGLRSIRVILPDVFEDLEDRYSNLSNGWMTGIPSGFRDLDRMTSGFQRSDLIIIGARPSVGKTALALNIARNAAVGATGTIAVFSLEMSEKQLVSRMICAEGNIDATSFRTGQLYGEDWEKVTMAIGCLSELPILIDDTPAISAAEIRSKCRKIKREQGLEMIVIDYLQLMAGRGKAGENRQEEVSHISRTLKQIARELEVPVIALSQLSRGVEQRQDKRPMMSDLRESGSIEQDADIVAFLYRDDYYDKETEKKNIIEIIIAKQRNGPVGTVELIFLKNFNKFASVDRSHHEQSEEQRQNPRASSYNVPDMHSYRNRKK